MNGSDLNRRQFNKLTAAAFGGVVAGSIVGCGKTPAKKKKTGGNGSNGKNGDEHDPTLLSQEPHVCRGLNMCENKGASKSNACAGQGTCATADKHTCAGENKCKGQGGCKEYPGQNSCEKKGECGVPLKDDAWTKAREAFKAQVEKAGKKMGEAPKKA